MTFRAGRPPGVVALVALLALGALAACHDHAVVLDRLPAVTLPIEVLGAVGTTETVEIRLRPDGDARAIALRLWLVGVPAPGKAAVRVNEAPWVSLDASTATPLGYARAFGGIGGPLDALAVDVPLPPGTLRTGGNRLAFRLDRDDDGSVGFRVRRLDVVNADGASELAPGQLRADDPASWRPRDPGAIAEGERLWRSAPLVERTATGPRPLRARCADCHAADGRDLKYFGFSDRSIVAWSQRLGLSAAQGEAIASFVRSRPVPTWGRPWDPPYQPGPGLDDRPIERWAAGAGLDAVAERDADAWLQVFPAGQVPTAIDGRATLAARNVPLTWPLPRWIRWLPRIHPLDAWGDEFARHGANTRYQSLRQALGAPAGAPSLEAAADAVYAWSVEWGERLGVAKREDRALGSDPLRAEKLASSGAWMLVKTWELMQEFGLEAAGASLYPRDGERRTWIGHWPTFEARLAWNEREAPADVYERMVWRQLQLLVNPGTRHQNVHLPVDWSSYDAASRRFAEAFGLPEASRLYVRAVKGLQASENGIGPDRPGRGWSLTRADPTRLVEDRTRALWTDVPPATRRQLVEAYLRAWLDKSESYPPELWERTAGARDTSWQIEPADFVPEGRGTGAADRLRAALPALEALGVEPALVERVCRLARALWPRGTWSTGCP